ncbi:MAG: FAD-dependent oxidoreductase [Lentisphaeria bacterium]|nr:FAD-dependent oxidoreductase [Lentisphaeria bacterium]
MDFSKNYDIAVVGAGIAGVAAAVQAAREGKKVVLIEKTIFPGGLATTGLVYVYLPICDGNGRQVSFGITEELLKLSIKYGPGNIPEHWKDNVNASEPARYRCIFSPAAYILALDEYLRENQVDVWYDTLVCDTEVENDRMTAVFVENESGRGKINAKCFVDASGTAILARRANIPCHTATNFLAWWEIRHDSRVEHSDLGAPVRLNMGGIPWDESKAPEGTLFRGISGKSVTEFVTRGRQKILEYYKEQYSDTVTRENFYSLNLPAMPQFRKIYSIDARYVLRDNENNKHFPDSIGLAPDWRKSGPVWEIPYDSLIPTSGPKGFIAAGRCTGADGDAWEVTRVIPVAGMTGQVAGLAASMAIDAGISPSELDVQTLQAKLRTLGFPLYLPEVGLEYDK